MSFTASRTVGLRVYSEGAENSWGDLEPSWAEPVSRAVYGWGPTPQSEASESVDAGRNSVEVGLRVYGPESSLGDVSARDRLVIAGALYEVDGAVMNYNYGPFDYAPGVRVDVKRVEG